jgi:hypothetical protein
MQTGIKAEDLEMQIMSDEEMNMVLIAFKQPVGVLALSQEQAREFANYILQKARDLG